MFESYLLGLTAIMLLCLIFWFIYLLTDLSSVIDTGWSLGIALGGGIYLFQETLTVRSGIIFICLMLWSVRLAGFLFWTRLIRKIKDKRYEKISENWTSKKFMFLLNYLFQGWLMSLIAIPFYFVAKSSSATFDLLDWFTLGIFIFALVFESLSDWQLYLYQKKPKDKVCRCGLWRYSRHPNYFFEWMIWIAFALWGLKAPYGYMAFVAPLALLSIMSFLTGPITERKSLESRGRAYLKYQQETSAFFPWFSKEKSS